MDELCLFSDFTKYKIKHSESIFTRFYQCHILPKNLRLIKEEFIFLLGYNKSNDQ